MSRVLVLAVDSPVPPVSGARLRTLHLARQLASRHEVEVAALEPIPDIDEPFRLVRRGSFRPRPLALASATARPYQAAKLDSRALARHAAQPSWDTVQAPLYLLPAAAGSGHPMVLDAYDVESDTAASLAATEPRRLHAARRRWEHTKTVRFEIEMVRMATAVCAASEQDASRLVEMGASEPLLVPNGVDVETLVWQPPPSVRRIAYVGNFGYRPNVDAATELVEQVLPGVPGAEAIVVGRGALGAVGRLAGARVRVLGDVADVVPHLRSARALVVPLRAGSGTRLKVLEAMALGVPVVSTPLGVHGLDVRNGTDVLIADSAADLADATRSVLDDDDVADGMSNAARRLVEHRYSWAVVARPLIDLHARLAQG